MQRRRLEDEAAAASQAEYEKFLAQQDAFNNFQNSDWTRNKGQEYMDLERAVGVGIALPPEVRQSIIDDALLTGVFRSGFLSDITPQLRENMMQLSDQELWGRFVERVQGYDREAESTDLGDIIKIGTLGFMTGGLGLGIAPFIAPGMLGVAGGMGLAGTGMGLAQGLNFEDALKGGALSAVGGVAGPLGSQYLGGMLGSAAPLVGQFGASMLGAGGDMEEAFKRWAAGQAAGYVGGELGDVFGGGAAPSIDIDPAMVDPSVFGESPSLTSEAPMEPSLDQGGMLRTGFKLTPGGVSVPARFGGTDALGNEIMSSSPAMTQVSLGGSDLLSTMAPTDVVAPLSTSGALAGAATAAPELEAMDAENRAALESGDNLQAQSERDYAEAQRAADFQRYAKIGETLYEILGSDGAPAGAPTREEEETEEQFQQELAQYLSLDGAAMAEMGLTPGTPEYMEYILAQADSVIAQITEGMDVDAEDLSAQLRTKTDAELQQLQRALYVRGQLGVQMGSGTYEDPFTGTQEEVVTPGGMLVNPIEAAYARGRARNVSDLAGMQGSEALDYLNSLLGRDADLFGMQQAADEHFEQAKLEENDEIRRRRRGMLY